MHVFMQLFGNGNVITKCDQHFCAHVDGNEMSLLCSYSDAAEMKQCCQLLCDACLDVLLQRLCLCMLFKNHLGLVTKSIP